jgi:exosortase K
VTANKNIPYYLTAIGLFILLKFGYTLSDFNDLTFLLKPTNKLVGFLTGSHSVYIQSSGYFYEQLNIVIDKSCSGFNFWLLCFLMLTFLTLKYFNKNIQKAFALLFSIVGAYILTIFINSSRILASIIINNHHITIFDDKREIIHETVGIVINLFFLILIYLIVERILINRNRNAKFA